MSSTMINEDRLFKLLPFFFENPQSVLIELAQNALRSGATGMSIKQNGYDLIVKDNGRGANDPSALFVLAQSDWPEEVERTEMPAGWGLYFLYSLCSRIRIKSLFGSIDFEPGEFLENREYREGILARINPDDRRSRGFEIRAELKPEAAESLLENADSLLKYFPLIIMVNGKRVERILPEIEYATAHIKTNYQGNVLLIRPDRSFPRSEANLWNSLFVIWHGIPIKERYNYFSPDIILDVTSGSPVTPVLPYRSSIKVDDKLSAFYVFCKEQVIAYARNLIQTAPDKTIFQVESAMKIMGDLASQEELDSLDFFYVERVEPYHCDGYDHRVRQIQVVSRGESISGEVLKLTINGKEVESQDIVLPEGVVVSLEVPTRHPGWLTVDPVEVVIDVKPVPDTGYAGALSWEKAVITGSKAVTVLYDGNDTCDGTLYYADDPNDFHQIAGIVFSRFFYCEDGDTFDSQQCEFESNIAEDLMKLVERYPLWKLLEGFTTAGITSSNIRLIQVRKKAVTVTLKDKSVKIIKLK